MDNVSPMTHHLIIRIHIDPTLGLGHLTRALAIYEEWKLLGGKTTLVVSGDERAREVGRGKNILSGELPPEIIDLGENSFAPLGKTMKGEVVLFDQWTSSREQIKEAHPRKIALMEDDGDAYEEADLLFQPYLEGIVWPDHPTRTKNGIKLKPHEDIRGKCHVLCGATYIVASPIVRTLRPKRQPDQPLNAQKILVTFGGSDAMGLAQKAFDILKNLQQEGRWRGSSVILAPQGIRGDSFPGCTVHTSMTQLSEKIQQFDVIWCAGGVTLIDALCLGIPVVAWGQNERQVQGLTELGHHGSCFGLGEGPSADPQTVQDALEHWLGPEGQESRQEQVAAGMALIDGLGATRVAKELWKLAEK